MSQVLHKAVQQLRRMAGRSEAREKSDRQLLERFAQTGNEEAFASLVHRHGSMVLSVCRRVLGNVQDAEDALQATFLVLARKAGSQLWQDSIGSWLHGVAYRIALKARTATVRRKMKESQVCPRTPSSPDDPHWTEVRRALDEELQNLPSRYRAPLILCYLEGKTRDEAAEDLGWSVGSVKGRLERGRDVLRQRLLQRGMSLPAVLCAGLLAEPSAEAAIGSSLITASVQAAVPFAANQSVNHVVSANILALAQGALQAMMIAKLKIGSLVLVTIGLLGLGTTWVAHYALADLSDTVLVAQDNPIRKETPPAKGRDKDAPVKDAPAKDAPRREAAKDEPRKVDGERRDGDGVRGTIKELDLEKGIITITMNRDDDRGDRTYNLFSKDLKVNFGEQPGKLADLRQGMIVTLNLKDNTDVVGIRAENPIVTGFLYKIDPDQGTVSLRIEGKIRALEVSPEARIRLGDRPLKLAEVPTGQKTQLTLSFDRKTVLALQVIGRAPGAEEPRREGGKAPEGWDRERSLTKGVVVDIDHAKNTMNLLIGKDQLEIKTFEVAKDAKVRVIFEEQTVEETTFAKLGKAVYVVLHLSDDGKLASQVDLQAPMWRGTLKDVDAANRKVTIGGGEQVEKTLQLAPNARINPRGREIHLADLPKGTLVQVALTLDRSQVIAIQILRRDGDER